MTQTKVLIAFKNPAVDSPTACHQGLGITALSVAMSLREMRITADARPVANGEHLWAQLGSEWNDVTHVVLSAPFIDAAYLEKLFRQYPDKHFTTVYHSNLGFLSQDRFAGKSIPLYIALENTCRNFTLASNCAELSEAMQAATGMPFACLPNLYHLPHTVRRTRELWSSGKPLHVGIFGAARVLKNWLTAGAAAMILSRTLNTEVQLSVSSGRDEGSSATRDNLNAILSLNSNVHLTEVPWLGHDDFLRHLYGMDLLLQPSYTETFNNVTADGCYCGVPSVVSEAIGWAPSDWVAKADSAVDIARVARTILRDRKAPEKGWRALDAHNKTAGVYWSKWLGGAR